ncbi:MAG: DUF4080 domain-containing protein [Peptoniphilus sp.]|nr:DUF4080 domain-containing protein [Peptoniphilus sp.]MDD7362522.1 DUF4080 domain-containing protein [Bacillota bacterium]MDY6045079.1 DUF4080 domain-containing protein [Peptoniphilus sp.]
MKGLLVAFNASYVHTNLAVRLLKEVADRPLAVLEMTVNEPEEQCLAKIALERPDFIMYSTYIWNWERVRRIGAYIRKANPSVRQFLGGPEVSYDACERMRDHSWIDGILCGEGELSFNDLLTYIEGDKPPSRVPGLCYRKGKAVYLNAPPESGSTLDYLPSVTYPSDMGHKIIYYESMRGCPYACSYCLSSTDDDVRYRSVEDIKRDMRHIFETGTKLIKFVDRSFHIRPERTKEILSFFIDEAPRDMCIHFEMNLEHMSDDIIRLMNRAPRGRFQIEAGIQSTNDAVNARIHRRTDLRKISEVAKRIDREKIHTHVDLIVGLPGEGRASFLNGFDEVVPIGAKRIQIGFLKLLPGTELRARAEEFGIVYDSEPPYEVIRTPDLSAREVLTLKYFATVVETFYDEDAFRETRRLLSERDVKLSRLFYAMARELRDNVDEAPLRGQNGKYRFFYDALKKRGWLDSELYAAFKKDFYMCEDRYIGRAIDVDDPEVDREAVVAFIKSHPEFIETADPLKASKNVRGIVLNDTIRYLYYERGKCVNYYDDRRNDG